MSLASGHEVEMVDGDEGAKLQKDFKGYTMGLVRLNPGRWFFPASFTKYADSIYNFEFRSSDVLIMTFMKCGTTWMQEIIWTMRNNPDLNHPDGKQAINLRVPFLDCDMFLETTNLPQPSPDDGLLQHFNSVCSGKSPKDGMFLQMAQVLPDPRTIKTHLPLSLIAPSLLDQTKLVYVARDPRDVLFSYLHHAYLFKSIDYTGSFQQFLDYYLNDELVYSPYWLHVREAWEKRHHPNLHFVFFEDLKADVMTELQKLNEFLDTNLTSDQLEKVADYTSFAKMKERDNLFSKKDSQDDGYLYNIPIKEKDGGFFRKGESGGWKDGLSDEQKGKIEEWIDRHFTSHGITFKTS